LNTESIQRINKTMTLAASELRNQANTLRAQADWLYAEATRLEKHAAETFAPGQDGHFTPPAPAMSRPARPVMPQIAPGEVENGIAAALGANLDEAMSRRAAG